MELDKITINIDGKTEDCKILFTTHLDEFDKDYVVFVLPNEELTAASYVEGNNGEGVLSDIETEEEWAKLGELLDSYFDELEE